MPRWLVMFSGLEEATVTLSHHLLFGGLTAFAFVFAGAQTAPAKRAKTAMVFFLGRVLVLRAHAVVGLGSGG